MNAQSHTPRPTLLRADDDSTVTELQLGLGNLPQKILVWINKVFLVWSRTQISGHIGSYYGAKRFESRT